MLQRRDLVTFEHSLRLVVGVRRRRGCGFEPQRQCVGHLHRIRQGHITVRARQLLPPAAFPPPPSTAMLRVRELSHNHSTAAHRLACLVPHPAYRLPALALLLSTPFAHCRPKTARAHQPQGSFTWRDMARMLPPLPPAKATSLPSCSTGGFGTFASEYITRWPSRAAPTQKHAPNRNRDTGSVSALVCPSVAPRNSMRMWMCGRGGSGVALDNVTRQSTHATRPSPPPVW